MGECQSKIIWNSFHSIVYLNRALWDGDSWTPMNTFSSLILTLNTKNSVMDYTYKGISARRFNCENENDFK